MSGTLPPRIAESLASAPSPVALHGEPEPCQGTLYHSPRPLLTKVVVLALPTWLEGETHGVVPVARLCGTCESNVTLLLTLLVAHEGELAWPVRREFGNQVRALAQQGWEWWVRQPQRL